MRASFNFRISGVSLGASFLLCAAMAQNAQKPLQNAQPANGNTPVQSGAPDDLQRADAAFHAGYAAVGRGDLAAARSSFELVVQLAPNVEEGHSALGAVLYQQKAYAEAVAELSKAVSMKSDDQAAMENLAMSYVETADFKDALSLFQKLSSGQTPPPGGSPLAPDLLAGYARAEAATGQYASAIDHMQAAVAADPGNAVLCDELGSLYAQQQNWPLADKAFEQAIQIDPRFALAHLHLGIALVQEQRGTPANAPRLQQALDELSRATQLDPQNAVAELESGKALATANRDEEAIPHFEQALKLNAALVDADNELAMALQRVGETQQSIPLFEKVIAAQPQNTSAMSNLALALVQTGKAKDAISYGQKVLSIAPNDPGAHQILGVAYLQQSDVDDALREFRAALAVTPDNPQLHYNLGLALKLKDDLPDAVKELEEAARLDPESPDAPYTLGILYMQTGRFDEAVKNLTQSLDRRPGNGDGWAVLGSVYRQQGKNEDAAAALRKAIDLLPNQPGPHITLASVLQDEGRKDEAAAERKTAAELTRVAVNRQRAQFATNAANSYLEKGQIADAVSHYQDAINSDPTFAEAHRQLAIAYEREGRAADAANERAAAAKLETTHP